MSVRPIKNGRFDGIRVQRTVAGEPVIKSWSFRVPEQAQDKTTAWRAATKKEQAEMLKEAIKFDKELMARQKASATKRVYDPFNPTKRNNTGIRGLNFRLRKENGQQVEVFFLTLALDDGQMHNRYHRIDTLGYEEAWTKAIEEIGELKGLSNVVIDRMKAKMPQHDAVRETLGKTNESAKRKRVPLSNRGGSGRTSVAAARAR